MKLERALDISRSLLRMYALSMCYSLLSVVQSFLQVIVDSNTGKQDG
jgi:hypothetical protein